MFQRLSQILRRRMIILVGLLPGMVCAESYAEWDTYQGNSAHTGYVPGTFNVSGTALQWQSVPSAGGITGLAVGGNTVFATNNQRFGNAPSFNAYDQALGSLLWSKQYTNIASTSAPAYADGLVYFQTDGHSAIAGNYLHAYAARTGASAFDAPYSAQWETYLNPTPFNGNVYVGGGYYGGMYSLNAGNGHQNWFGTVPQYDGWTPAIDGKFAYSFTGSGDTTPINGVLTMINLATGTTAATVVDPIYDWRGYTMNSAVVLGAKHDAFGINGGRLIAWDTTLDASHTPHIAWSKSASFKGQPVLANSRIYAIDGDGLDVLDESTGNLLWNWSAAGQPLVTTIIVTDNVAFVGTSTTTYAVDLGLHTSNWSYPASGIMALSDNTLYIGTSDGVVDAVAAPEPSGLLLVAVAGTFFFRRSRPSLRE